MPTDPNTLNVRNTMLRLAYEVAALNGQKPVTAEQLIESAEKFVGYLTKSGPDILVPRVK